MGLLSDLGFGAPWILAGLVLLPAIWWLLRVTPPSPRRVVFPPLRLLLGLKPKEETPARTPWWLLLLRLIIAAIVIFALAAPIWGAKKAIGESGPLVLFVDNGWPSAHLWNVRVDAMEDALIRAARADRPVVILPTADAPRTISFLDAAKADRTARNLTPESWLPQRARAAAALEKAHFPSRPEILWLSDGLDHDDGARVAARLAKIGDLHVFTDAPGKDALALLPPDNRARGFQVKIARASADGPRKGSVSALGAHGELLAQAPFAFARGARIAMASLDLPLEMRNKTQRIEIANENSAGAVQLLDANNRRRAVGLVSAGDTESEQPLLSDLYYLQRALAPYAQLTQGTIGDVLDRHSSVLVLADVGKITGAYYGRVAHFIADGGVLIRFAGPRMTQGTDDLIPVKLRSGGRYLGGAMEWAKPQHLAAFPGASPFSGLAVPREVTVDRQILAEPSVELGPRTWARLQDGTPLVTAEHRGKGWIVLFHVTAGPEWSSLPLSGLYVEMLRRLLDLAGTQGSQTATRAAVLPPVEMLDGAGHLGRPRAEALPIRRAELAHLKISEKHPPGYYGAEGAEIAINAMTPSTDLTPLSAGGARVDYYAEAATHPLQAPLLTLAVILILIDALISLGLRGLLARPRLARVTTVLLCAMLVYPMTRPRADDAFDMKAALDTRLAYVITGLPDVDNMSKAGLTGLDIVLTQRTSYEPEEPMGVDIEKDDLSFFPLLYWPMDPREKTPSPAAIAKLQDYMRKGGTILFDTRDLSLGAVEGAQSPGEQTLRRIASQLDLPPLEPIPPDHVLTKAFYLLNDFPGRWDGGKVWVQALPKRDANAGPEPARGGDGVSPVIIGPNDWAAAWAVDQQGRPLADPTPGGERQREMAYRFGINVVMYALTGNYKTDQVHVPALLQRLGK